MKISNMFYKKPNYTAHAASTYIPNDDLSKNFTCNPCNR